MTKKKILVSGSLVYDKIMDFKGRFGDYIMPDKIHKLSVCFVVDRLKINFGGTAGNIAYNLKMLGEEPVVLSQAGQDFGDYKKWLDKNRINTSGIKIIKSKNTASAHIITDRADNQITALHLETMGVPSDITEAKIKKYDNVSLAIVAPGNVKDMMAAVKVYKKLSIKYVADPGQQIPALSARELNYLIEGAKVLICNDYEMELIIKSLKQKNTRLPSALPQANGGQVKTLKQMVEILIITYGARGSVIYNQGKEIKIKADKPRKVVDPTGAGDAYRAGFVKGLVNGLSLQKCGELASWVAKWPVENYGTQEHNFKIQISKL